MRKSRVFPANEGESIVVTAMRLASQVHPVRVIIPGMKFSAERISLGFACTQGCFHEFTMVETRSGPGWLEGLIVKPPQQDDDDEFPDEEPRDHEPRPS